MAGIARADRDRHLRRGRPRRWQVGARCWLMLGTPLETGKMIRLESAPKIRVLIVERHMAVRRALRKRLSSTSDLDVLAAVQEPAAALPYLEPDGPVHHRDLTENFDR